MIFISPETEDFATGFATLFQRFIADETGFGWNGPYVNWKRDVNRNDWPDDPWGNDYILITRLGALFPPNPLDNSSSVNDDQFEDQGPDNGEVLFDRPTILSLGPNGLAGDGATGARYGTGDDIFRSF